MNTTQACLSSIFSQLLRKQEVEISKLCKLPWFGGYNYSAAGAHFNPGLRALDNDRSVALASLAVVYNTGPKWLTLPRPLHACCLCFLPPGHVFLPQLCCWFLTGTTG